LVDLVTPGLAGLFVPELPESPLLTGGGVNMGGGAGVEFLPDESFNGGGVNIGGISLSSSSGNGGGKNIGGVSFELSGGSGGTKAGGGR
jgi:hypothetical protein